MPKPIILYDLASRTKPNRSWSGNVWKTRLYLNYKSIPYETVWLNHATIASTLQGLGVQPAPEGSMSQYSLPTIQFPNDGHFTMDSAIIAAELEQLHPSPSMHLNPDLEAEAQRALGMISFPLLPVLMPRVGRDIIEEDSIPLFRSGREKRFGMPLEEWEVKKGGEPAWSAAAPGLAALKALLTDKKKDDGPFILGSQVCYADFMVVALLEGLRRIGQDIFDRIVSHDESFVRLHDACKKWMENDR